MSLKPCKNEILFIIIMRENIAYKAQEPKPSYHNSINHAVLVNAVEIII